MPQIEPKLFRREIATRWHLLNLYSGTSTYGTDTLGSGQGKARTTVSGTGSKSPIRGRTPFPSCGDGGSQVRESSMYHLIKSKVHDLLGESEESLKTLEAALELTGVKSGGFIEC